jgi:hypothetical protein
MLHFNHKRTTSSLALPIFYVAKKFKNKKLFGVYMYVKKNMEHIIRGANTLRHWRHLKKYLNCIKILEMMPRNGSGNLSQHFWTLWFSGYKGMLESFGACQEWKTSIATQTIGQKTRTN